ncbi:MAG: hypothetical protein KA764_20475 [Anaerolineales bacterium]|nr:hypothetical protein [Anaerolineales bacterium]
MSNIETLLAYPLAPSEMVLLNGAAFAPAAGPADRLALFDAGQVVTASVLIRAMLAAAFLAAEQAGALRLEARGRQTPFGPSKIQTLYVEAGASPEPGWPAGCVEAALPALAARLRASGAHEAGHLISAWLGAESANPWQAAAEAAQRGLAQRGLLDTAEVVKFGFVKTPVFQRPAETAALAARGPVAAVQALLREGSAARPEVWARLGEQIDGGLRQRLKAGAPAPARKTDDDE